MLIRGRTSRFIVVPLLFIAITLLTACGGGGGGDAGTSASVLPVSSSGVSSGANIQVSVPASSGSTLKDIIVSWVAPSTRSDGSALSLSEISAYRIYVSKTSQVYSNYYEVAGGLNMEATLSGIDTGKYYVSLTTIDSDGRESGFSRELAVQV